MATNKTLGCIGRSNCTNRSLFRCRDHERQEGRARFGCDSAHCYCRPDDQGTEATYRQRRAKHLHPGDDYAQLHCPHCNR